MGSSIMILHFGLSLLICKLILFFQILRCSRPNNNAIRLNNNNSSNINSRLNNNRGPLSFSPAPDLPQTLNRLFKIMFKQFSTYFIMFLFFFQIHFYRRGTTRQKNNRKNILCLQKSTFNKISLKKLE